MTIKELKEKVNDPIITDHNEIKQILWEIVSLPARNVYDRNNFNGICDWVSDIGQKPASDISLYDLLIMVKNYCSEVSKECQNSGNSDLQALINSLSGKCLFFDKSIFLRTVYTRSNRRT